MENLEGVPTSVVDRGLHTDSAIIQQPAVIFGISNDLAEAKLHLARRPNTPCMAAIASASGTAGI